MKGRVNFREVNVRKEPNGPIKEIVTEGMVLTITAKKDGWYKTSRGYIREDLMDIIKEKK